MTKEGLPKLRMPPMAPEDILTLLDSTKEDLCKKISEKSETGEMKNCDWCGQNCWEMNKYVFTDVVFDIVSDRHVSSRVDPLVKIECANCGNTKRFNIENHGYATKHGVK